MAQAQAAGRHPVPAARTELDGEHRGAHQAYDVYLRPYVHPSSRNFADAHMLQKQAHRSIPSLYTLSFHLCASLQLLNGYLRHMYAAYHQWLYPAWFSPNLLLMRLRVLILHRVVRKAVVFH